MPAQVFKVRRLRYIPDDWMGRTGRQRRRRRGGPTRPADLSATVAPLLRWMTSAGWTGPGALAAALFPDTGRGLLSRTAVQPGQTLLSLPRQLLITTETALASERLRAAARAARPPLSGQMALALYLVQQQRCGARSWWRPYLDSLPPEYTTPAYCSADEVCPCLLPGPLLAAARRQRALVTRQYQRACQLLADWQISAEEFRHAWFTVNTRAVYLSGAEQHGSVITEDTSALAPFLDLFNHSAGARVSCHVAADGSYRLVTEDAFPAGEQVFISYGPHDNQRLWLEYGFVVPDNGQDAVPVPEQWLPLPPAAADRPGLSADLSVSRTGVSWGLAVRLYLSAQPADRLAAGGAAWLDLWRLSVEQMLEPAVARRRLAELLVRLLRSVEACLAAQRARPAPSAALRVCGQLLQQWCHLLAGHVWRTGNHLCDDGRHRSVYRTSLGQTVECVELGRSASDSGAVDASGEAVDDGEVTDGCGTKEDDVFS